MQDWHIDDCFAPHRLEVVTMNWPNKSNELISAENNTGSSTFSWHKCNISEFINPYRVKKKTSENITPDIIVKG